MAVSGIVQIPGQFTVIPDGQTGVLQAFTDPVTTTPGTTITAYAYISSSVTGSFIVQFHVLEIFGNNSVDISANTSVIPLTANATHFVSVNIAIPGGTPVGTYRIDVLVYTPAFASLFFVQRATVFHVQSTAITTLPFKIGVYRAAQDPIAIKCYENWLGRKVDYILDTVPAGNVGDANLTVSWQNMVGNGWTFFATKWTGYESRMILSIPMLPAQGNFSSPSLGSSGAGIALGNGATGSYDSFWVTMGQNLVNSGYANNYIRLGWEMNGNWFNWSAIFNSSSWVVYFQRIVGILRATPGANFKFVFNPTLGQQQIGPDTIYPGNTFVDAIGLDVYDQDFNGHYPILVTDTSSQVLAKQQAVWASDLNSTSINYDLPYWSNFATTNSKPFGVYEWGCMATTPSNGGGDDTYYVQQMHDYAVANSVSHMVYFDLTGDQALFDSREVPTAYPNASTLYRTIFGPTG